MKLHRPTRHDACRIAGCDWHWEPVTINGQEGKARICRRPSCRRVTSLRIYGLSPAVASGIDATCSTDNRPAFDWPGCTD